jgi:hypothetical protein
MAEAAAKYNQNPDLSANKVVFERRLKCGLAQRRGPFCQCKRKVQAGAESSRHLGASTITTWRPSKRGSCSTLATLDVSSLTRLRS